MSIIIIIMGALLIICSPQNKHLTKLLFLFFEAALTHTNIKLLFVIKTTKDAKIQAVYMQ